MSQTIVVTYDGGVLRPETPLDLEPAKRYVATLVPIDDVAAPASAWDVLDALRGAVEAPADWAAQHDHYLYGTAKRETGQGQ